MELQIEGIPETCWLTHYPSQARGKQCGLQQKDYFSLVGHIHSAWRCQLNMINVGVDCWCYKPVSLPQIAEFYKVITTLYDDDIWAAYMPSNMIYKGVRGKKGSYFQN